MAGSLRTVLPLTPGLFILLALGGCRAARPPVDPGPPGADLRAFAEGALEATMPESPVQITFDFRLREADLRFAGQGVARIQPPYRVRIDLFSNQGEGLFTAALVESDLRVPPGVPLDLAPPPALLWAALGVFRPDRELRLTGGRGRDDGSVTLWYGGPAGEDLRFRLEEGNLRRAELYDGGHLVEEVDLDSDGETGKVAETVYRNHALFVELIFTLKSERTVESFPPEIWNPIW